MREPLGGAQGHEQRIYVSTQPPRRTALFVSRQGSPDPLDLDVSFRSSSIYFLTIEIPPTQILKKQAASLVARCWRRYVHRREYRVRRDLLVQRAGVVAGSVSDNTSLSNSGDYHRTETYSPNDIIHDAPNVLWLANPKEATLTHDRGACAHVRLRLGIGEGNYPYKIGVYYRIFTHHHVADLNAMSPRQYFQESKRKAQAGMARTKNQNTAITSKNQNNKSRLHTPYTRTERNDWRLMSAHALRALASDTLVSRRYLQVSDSPSEDSFENGLRFSRSVSSSSSSSPRLNAHRRRAVDSTRKAMRVTNRGVRTPMDGVTRHGVLQRRFRAWSAGADGDFSCFSESNCDDSFDELQSRSQIDDETNYSYDSNDSESVDSLLEWSLGLDFDTYTSKWRENLFEGKTVGQSSEPRVVPK